MDEYFCSICGKPVNEDDSLCPHCGAKLDEIIDDVDEQNSVVIKTFLNNFEAETAQEFLRECGIDSFISKDDAGGMYPHHFGGVNNFRLVVLEPNAEEALKVLESLENNEVGSDENTEDI